MPLAGCAAVCVVGYAFRGRCVVAVAFFWKRCTSGMFLTYVFTYALLSGAPQGPLYTYTYELVSRGALRAGCGHFLRAAKGVVSLVLPDSPAYTYARTRTLSPMVLHVHVRTPVEGASHRLPYVYSPWGLPGVCSINGGMCSWLKFRRRARPWHQADDVAQEEPAASFRKQEKDTSVS